MGVRKLKLKLEWSWVCVTQQGCGRAKVRAQIPDSQPQPPGQKLCYSYLSRPPSIMEMAHSLGVGSIQVLCSLKRTHTQVCNFSCRVYCSGLQSLSVLLSWCWWWGMQVPESRITETAQRTELCWIQRAHNTKP